MVMIKVENATFKQYGWKLHAKGEKLASKG